MDTTIAGGNPCIYTRKETPQPINHERKQPRNNECQFMSPSKNTGEEETDLNLSIVSDEEFDCYTKSEGKPVQTNINDELQLLPNDNKLTPGQGIYKGKSKVTERETSVRRSNRLPFAKQTEKLGGVPYQLITLERNKLLTRMYYRKRRQQQRRLKMKITAQFGKKPKKSV